MMNVKLPNQGDIQVIGDIISVIDPCPDYLGLGKASYRKIT